MAFKLPKTEMSWSEPYFFLMRIRTAKAWMVRGLIAFGIMIVIFAAMQLDQQRFQRLGILGALGIGALAGVTLMAYADMGNVQREVTIRDDCIIYNSAINMGIYWHGSFEFKDILQVALMRPEDWNMPHGAMLVHTSDDVFLLAVPQKVSLETIANVLHRLGVTTQLKGWTPPEHDTRVQVTEEVVIKPPATKFAGVARIWDVAPEDGPLVPTAATAWSFVVGLAPVAIALLGAIAAGIYVVVMWKSLSIVEKSAIGGGALVAVIAGFAHLILIGQFHANRIVIAAARKALRTRGNSLFSVGDDSLVPVEVFDRTAWTTTILKELDFGFLQVDRARGALRFEGKHQRWEIPVTALSTCRIEEVRVGSEANENPEKRYYVVIASTRDGEPWEAGMTPTRTDFGSDGSMQRHERAQRLLNEIGAAVA